MFNALEVIRAAEQFFLKAAQRHQAEAERLTREAAYFRRNLERLGLEKAAEADLAADDLQPIKGEPQPAAATEADIRAALLR